MDIPGAKGWHNYLGSADTPFQKNTTSPAINRTLLDILRCDYEGGIRKMYLEGKVLELTAILLQENALERPVSVSSGISKTDIQALMLAKEILDRNLQSTPSIAELARQICLNEFKLKKGFKQLYGISVHAYVIERRLETAYRLLESGSLNVTAAAELAGFNKPSYFAEKFRGKYGANPSRYFRENG